MPEQFLVLTFSAAAGAATTLCAMWGISKFYEWRFAKEWPKHAADVNKRVDEFLAHTITLDPNEYTIIRGKLECQSMY